MRRYGICVQKHSLTVGEGISPCLKKLWMPGSGRGKDLHSFMTLIGQIGGVGANHMEFEPNVVEGTEFHPLTSFGLI